MIHSFKGVYAKAGSLEAQLLIGQRKGDLANSDLIPIRTLLFSPELCNSSCSFTTQRMVQSCEFPSLPDFDLGDTEEFSCCEEVVIKRISRESLDD